jgi:hypothetical protein
MASPQQQQIEQAEQETERLSKRAYSIALPGLGEEFSSIRAALANPESDSMKAAFGSARTSLMDASTTADRATLGKERERYRGAAAGGNVSAATATPEQMGTSMARSLYGSRITEAGAALGERDKMFAMLTGQGAAAGSGSLTAFGNELQNTQTMQPYNSAYSNVLGAINAAGTAYGALDQSGAFTSRYGAVGYSDPSGGYGNPFAGAGPGGT